ncbi:MAG: LolA-like putative outer membrane lipoprotein chaperone [Paludibacteraceae bacterium]|nr:LolA-like putative outer membrane lipoprotein chaperone [Paludibacteraceae bacterium]
MKKVFSLIAILFIAVSAFCQIDAKSVEILDKMSNIYKNSTGTELGLKIELEDGQSGTANSIKGTLKTKGNAFVLETSLANMTFDGKYLYVYNKEVNEITVSAPAPEEIQGIDPTSILGGYKKGYKVIAPEFKTEGNREIAVISLFPEDIEDPFFKTTISVDAKTYEPIGVSTHNKNGMISTINITKLKTNLNYTAKDLEFDLNKYPKAMLIDLR